MLPNQQFDGIPSGNPMPPWTPQVWADGPDGIVKEATQEMWTDYTEMTNGVLGTNDRAMSGPTTAPENESDQIIDSSTPGDSPSHSTGGTSRSSIWNTSMADLRRSEPLAAWSDGSKDGPANPGA